jgi:hypothetical protein
MNTEHVQHEGRASNFHLPGFLIGGAPRAGTTWLYHLLDRHPAIAMAKPVKPEPKFFLVDEIYEKGLAYYSAAWFQNLSPARLLGEKSTNYLESPVAASRIAADLPGIKLVFVLREPVSRAWSNYRWSMMNGLEDRDFLSALMLESEQAKDLPPLLHYAKPYDYFSRGLYASLLKPYIALFPRCNILCLRYEDIHGKRDRHRLVSTLHTFLGVAVRPNDGDSIGTINAADGEAEIPVEARAWLVKRYAKPMAELGELLGSEFRLWPTTDAP